MKKLYTAWQPKTDEGKLYKQQLGKALQGDHDQMQRELNTTTGGVLQMARNKIRQLAKKKKKKKYVEPSGQFKKVKGSRFKGCVESMMAKGKSKEDAQKLCAFIGRQAGRIREDAVKIKGKDAIGGKIMIVRRRKNKKKAKVVNGY